MVGGIFVILMLIIALSSLVAAIFYLLTLQRTLEIISPVNRRMDPNQVWMILIPGYGMVFQFMMLGKLSDSIKAEQMTKGIRCAEVRPAYQIGLLMCIANCAAVIPYLGILAMLGAIPLWIMYWLKIVEYKKQLEQGYGGYGYQDAEIIDDI